jgi:hypothetical protein
VGQIQVSGNDISVRSFEDSQGQARAIYRFSGDLEPVDVVFDDGFGVLHRRLEEQGLIKHSLARCPHLTAPTMVDRWDPQGNWRKIAVPPNANVKPGSLR